MPTKLKVLLVEDNPVDSELALHELIRAGYDPEWKRVETEPEFLAQLDQGWEIILADYGLPEFSGLRAIELLRAFDPDLPLIIVSGTIGEDTAVKTMKAGANDYIMKDRLERLGPAIDRELRDAIGRRARKKAEAELRESLASLSKALNGTIHVLSAVSEIRDPYTAGHQKRVGNLAQAIAQRMGLDPARVEGIRVGGIIHDIGKLSIPAEILSKPSRLSKFEYEMVKSHPQIGHDILADTDFAWPLADMARQHHERMDGSGYPQGLKGEAILLDARILAVADVIEAMASHRPYRASLGIEAALEEIEKNAGLLYDEKVVSACLRLFREEGYRLA
jgi:putative two-component system response regulator